MGMTRNYSMEQHISHFFLKFLFYYTGLSPWTNIMSILDEKDGGDTELLIYAMTLVNKVRKYLHFSRTCVCVNIANSDAIVFSVFLHALMNKKNYAHTVDIQSNA